MSHDNIPGVASFSSHSYSTDDAPVSALQQLSDEQRSRWEGLLQQIEQADHVEHGRAWATAKGYALCLRDSHRLSAAQYDELLTQLQAQSNAQGSTAVIKADALKADSDAVVANFARWRECGLELGRLLECGAPDHEALRRARNETDAAGIAYDISARLFADRVRWAIAIAQQTAP